MGGTNTSSRPFALSSRMVTVLILILAATVGLKAWGFHPRATTQALVDFDVFHIAGSKAWDGSFLEAYDFQSFSASQRAIEPDVAPMPWTYPPQFGFVAAALTLAAPWLSYLLFASMTLAGYLLVLRRIAGEQFPIVLLFALPVFFVNLASGQNGLLIGALVGLFALGSLQWSSWAGVPLGLMVIKPHLAVGLALWLLLSRSWVWLFQAAGIVVGTSLAATVAFGTAAWPAFLDALEQAQALLEAGSYTLFRMTSVYAGLRSLGMGAGLALACQGVVAVGGLALVILTCVRGWKRERSLAVAALASLLISPYGYDYDLALLGVVLALVAKDLARVPGKAVLLLLWTLAWTASGYGMLGTAGVALARVPENGGGLPALGGVALLLLAILLVQILWQIERDRAATPEWAGSPAL